VYMTTKLSVNVPDDLMKHFQALADSEFRTAEGQVLWLMTAAVSAAARGHRLTPPSRPSAEQRLSNSRPIFDALHELLKAAGAPSSRAIAARIGELGGAKYSHTTINGVLNGTTAPSWPVLEKIVSVLDGDVEHFHQLWAEASG
jgi:hypothetical protein